MKKISEMTVAELRARAAEIRGLVDKPDADLEALENIADQISQNNAIMQAMYGDIMSALNAILEKTGSLEAAQEVANAYILQVVQQLQQLMADRKLSHRSGNRVTISMRMGHSLSPLSASVNMPSMGVTVMVRVSRSIFCTNSGTAGSIWVPPCASVTV